MLFHLREQCLKTATQRVVEEIDRRPLLESSPNAAQVTRSLLLNAGEFPNIRNEGFVITRALFQEELLQASIGVIVERVYLHDRCASARLSDHGAEPLKVFTVGRTVG